VRRADGGELRLASNLAPEEAAAVVLALLYRRRWQNLP
jgi:IS4 transposase